MKLFPRKALSLLLAFAMTLSLPVFAAASDAMGDDLDEFTEQLARGVNWTKNTFWSNSQSDLRSENYVTYSPSSRVTPIVTYGESITSRAKLTDMAKQLEREGYRVVAGINGDFYNTANGVPLGLVVTDGIIRSGSSYYYALGFLADGEMIFGTPNLTTMATAMNEETGQVLDIIVQDINKDRGDKGVYLYTYDFNAKHTTGTTAAGTDVILTLVEGELTIGGTVTLAVQRVLTDNSTAVTLDENTFVLSANNSSPEIYRSALQSLTPGTEVTVSVRAESEDWNQVTHAVGTLYQLVESGRVHSDASLVSGSAPRTAVGIKRNGDILFYTMDGRQKGHSVGATYTMVAKRLIELGCETAFAMDGGGSTGMLLSLPGQNAALHNSPSDGYERAVTNQIFLVTPMSEDSGFGGGYYIQPESRYVLAGAEVTFTVSPYDNYYQPIAADYTVSASQGEIVDGVFHAPMTNSNVTLAANGDGKRGSTYIQVVQNPDEIRISRDGSTVTALALRSGTEVQLDAKAVNNHMTLLSQNDCFTWSLTEGLGEIDENGYFIPGDVTMEGELVVSAGSTEVRIPVSVKNNDYFSDIKDSFAREYINVLYEKGVVNGMDDGTFQPDSYVTRQQFAAMLYRALGLKDEDFAEVELPFADADGLRSYSLIPVKALYSLGITTGTKSGNKVYFYPYDSISRAQAAAMIARALEVSSDVTPDFTDLDQFPSYAGPYVSALSEMGIIGGFKDGSFRPRNNITRAQMSKMLYMMLENQ